MAQKITKVVLDPKTLEFSVDNTGYEGKGCSAIVDAFAKGNEIVKDIKKPEYRLQGQTGVACSR